MCMVSLQYSRVLIALVNFTRLLFGCSQVLGSLLTGALASVCKAVRKQGLNETPSVGKFPAKQRYS